VRGAVIGFFGLSPSQSRSQRLLILATIPRSGTWFLRYSISFLCHLAGGGRIDDRLTGEIVGAASGAPFDFERFAGGPLFRVRPALPSDHLFIGHTVCPGFARVAAEVPWWRTTAFHVPGYDYLHDGFDYDWTPIDLTGAPEPYTKISPQALDRAPWDDEDQRIVLVYRDPLNQLDSFYHYSRTHAHGAYRIFGERNLGDVPFREFAFGGAIASYAKQFMSYQVMARHLPRQVKLVSYESMMARPLDVLRDLLGFLGNGARVDEDLLGSAIALARPEHLRAIERELGRSLDGTHSARHGHMRPPSAHTAAADIDDTAHRLAVEWLLARGLDPKYFSWPAEVAAPLAEARRAS